MIPPSVVPKPRIKNRSRCDAYLHDLNQLLASIYKLKDGEEVVKRLMGIANDARNNATEVGFADAIDSKSVALKTYVGKHTKWKTQEKTEVCTLMRDVINNVEAFLKRAEIYDMSTTDTRNETANEDPFRILSSSNDTITSQPNTELVSPEISPAALKRKLKTAEDRITTLSVTVQARDKTIQEYNYRLEEVESECKILKQEQDNLVEYQNVRQALEDQKNALPSSLRTCVEALFTVSGYVSERNISALTDRQGLDRLDRYVYQTPPAFGMLAQERDGTVTRIDLLRVIALQECVHQQLVQIGLKVICPSPGDTVDQSRHVLHPQEDVRIDDDPTLNNRVAGVKRIGYEHNGSIFRKAAIKRYVYQKGTESTVLSQATPVPPTLSEPQSVWPNALEQGQSQAITEEEDLLEAATRSE